MALKLIANYSKRLGLPGYSSHQFSVSVETEISNINDVAGESTRLYQLLQQNVDEEIQRTGFVPDEGYGISEQGARNGSRNGTNGHSAPANGNGHSTTRNPMLLHCGGQVIERDALFGIETPHPTETWFPLPHRHLVEEVESQLTDAGFNLLCSTHAISHDGNRYFGIIEVSPRGDIFQNGHGWVVGLRNSHDKTFPAGIVAGTRVFVCDNLSFSGLIQIRRKHTRFAVRDLRQLTARAVGQLGERLVGMEARITAYRNLRLTDSRAHDLVIRATDCRAITTSQIPEVLHHWRNSAHAEFAPRNGWSLWNACTEAFKSVNPHTAIARCEALHGLFDGAAGVALAS